MLEILSFGNSRNRCLTFLLLDPSLLASKERWRKKSAILRVVFLALSTAARIDGSFHAHFEQEITRLSYERLQSFQEWAKKLSRLVIWPEIPESKENSARFLRKI